MKQLITVLAFAFFANAALAQTLASSSGVDNGTNTSAPRAVAITENFVIVTGFREPALNTPNSVMPNYAKLSLVQSTSSTLAFNARFEGATNFQYIITNTSGEVVSIKERKLNGGVRSQQIDMSSLASGSYYITANVTSRETKAYSTY
ncbi:MAG: hypothetical protein RL660_2077, partial [Bacteroidota bacterium]